MGSCTDVCELCERAGTRIRIVSVENAVHVLLGPSLRTRRVGLTHTVGRVVTSYLGGIYETYLATHRLFARYSWR